MKKRWGLILCGLFLMIIWAGAMADGIPIPYFDENVQVYDNDTVTLNVHCEGCERLYFTYDYYDNHQESFWLDVPAGSSTVPCTISLYPKIPDGRTSLCISVVGYYTNPDTGSLTEVDPYGFWHFFDLQSDGQTPKPVLSVPAVHEKGKDLTLTMPNETNVAYRLVVTDSQGREAFSLARGETLQAGETVTIPGITFITEDDYTLQVVAGKRRYTSTASDKYTIRVGNPDLRDPIYCWSNIYMMSRATLMLHQSGIITLADPNNPDFYAAERPTRLRMTWSTGSPMMYFSSGSEYDYMFMTASEAEQLTEYYGISLTLMLQERQYDTISAENRLGLYGHNKTLQDFCDELSIPVPTDLLPAEVPALVIQNASPERNVYLGLEQYGDGIGADSIGVWGDFPWISACFGNYDELQSAYGGKPIWTIETEDGEIIYSGSGYEDSNFGVLEYRLDDLPSEPCDAEFTVSCEWGNQQQTVTCVVHYKQLAAIPTGHDYPETVTLRVGSTLTIEPHAEPMGWSIPGQNFRTYIIDDLLLEYADLDRSASTNTKKVYTVRKAGVCSATVLLSADTVGIGKETIFRFADSNGNVPVPKPWIISWNDMERNYWLVPGATPGAGGLGQLLSDDFLDYLYIGNESACRSELQEEPVWTVASSVSAYVGLRSARDGMMELYLKKMPTAAQDLTFGVTCSWGGQSTTETYTIHFMNVPDGLPTAVYIKPASWIRVVRAGTPFNYNFGFRNFNWIEGTEAWQDLSESLRDAVGWEEVPTVPGIYEGYVETGFDNVMWREKLTIVVTESDGTMSAADYRNFGTVEHLPADLRVIDSQAFAGTKLTEIDIPEGVAYIGEYAFDGSGLIGIYTHGNQVAIDYAVANGYVAIVE